MGMFTTSDFWGTKMKVDSGLDLKLCSAARDVDFSARDNTRQPAATITICEQHRWAL